MTTHLAYAVPERRVARPSPWWIGLAVLALAAITFVTLCPISLRPHFANADQERFAAFLVLGALVGRAAGRRGLAATAAVVLLALALEFAQDLAPGRHAAFSDALVKALGGVVGAAAAQLSFPLRRWVLRCIRRGAGALVAAD
jgi:hypothetical protein